MLERCPNCSGLRREPCPELGCSEGKADPGCLLCAGEGEIDCLDCEGTGGPVVAEVDGADFGRVWLPGQAPTGGGVS